MRELKTFGERTLAPSPRKPKPKYLLVYEGEKTEAIYFDAIKELRHEIGLNPLLDLVPLVRGYSEKGWSNPQKLVERVIAKLAEQQQKSISYATLMDRLLEELDAQLNPAVYVKIFNDICRDELKVTKKNLIASDDLPKCCRKVLELFIQKATLKELVLAVDFDETIDKIVNAKDITYDPDYDKICFIIDRDRESFTLEQYEKVKAICQQKNFGLFVTNPCFEFWLLLHFKEVFTASPEKLLKNQKEGRQRYTEKLLRQVMNAYEYGFSKNKYAADVLVRKVDYAIQNEKQFCEDLTELEHQLGSNLGLLITELRRTIV